MEYGAVCAAICRSFFDLKSADNPIHAKINEQIGNLRKQIDDQVYCAGLFRIGLHNPNLSIAHFGTRHKEKLFRARAQNDARLLLPKAAGCPIMVKGQKVKQNAMR